MLYFESVFVYVILLACEINSKSTEVYFSEFEQVNVYLRNVDVWSSKLFDSFILIYCDCVREDGN